MVGYMHLVDLAQHVKLRDRRRDIDVFHIVNITVRGADEHIRIAVRVDVDEPQGNGAADFYSREGVRHKRKNPGGGAAVVVPRVFVVGYGAVALADEKIEPSVKIYIHEGGVGFGGAQA